MAYQFPLNGGRLNASINPGGNTAGVPALVSTGTLHLAGGNNVTLSQNGASVTISGANIPTQTAYQFSNSNGVSFGTNGSTITATVATNYAASNHSHGNPTLNLTNLSGTTASASNGLTLSLSAAAQSVQTLGVYATGNTTGQSSSSTLDARSLSISALGGASVGLSGGMWQVAAPAVSSLSYTGIIDISTNGNTINIGAPAVSMGMSTLGNTTGTTGTVSNQLIFAGGNNVTLSQSTGAGGNTLSIGGPSLSNSNGFTFGTNGSIITASYNGLTSQSNQAISAGNGSFAFQTASFSNANGISFSTSAGSAVVASHNGITSQSNQAMSASNGSFAFQTAGFSNANGVTFGTSAGSIISASVNTSYAASNHSHGNPTLNLTNISGTTASASNGLTLSLSAAAQSNQNISLYALGNTTQNSSTLLNASNLSFNGLGGATVGFSNGSIQVSGATGGGGGDGGVALYDGANSISSGTARISASGALTASVNGQTLNFSVPATSSLSGAGGISLSTNGSTIIVSNNNTLNYYQNMDRGNSSTLAVPFASMMIQRLNQENGLFAGNITANTVLLNMTANMTATSLSSSHTVSVSIGIYSDNASNLTLINSASTSWALGAATGNTSNYNGPRWLSFVSSQWSSAPKFAQGGEYVFGIRFSTSNYAPPLSYFGQNYMLSNQRSGFIGTSMATATTLGQGNYWNGVINTAALPSSIAASQVNRNNASAIFIPHIILNNRYSGTM